MSDMHWPYDEFEYGDDSFTLGQRWEEWLEGFELYVIANDMDKTTIKTKAIFQLMIGKKARNILHLLKKSDNSDSLDDLAALLTQHFVGKRHDLAECITFRCAKKMPEESVDEFRVRLQRLAKYCNFKDLEEKILHQFLEGCENEMNELTRDFFKSNDLTLKKALELAYGYERINKILKANQERNKPKLSKDQPSHEDQRLRNKGYQRDKRN